MTKGTMIGDKDARTAEAFNYAWNKFSRREVGANWHKDSFSYVELLPKAIFDKDDMLALDVGCGSGADLIHMARKGMRMVGIDVTDAVKLAYRNTRGGGDIRIAQASVYDLPFKEESFDLVYSFGVLHHLSDPQDAFRKMVTLAKHGGTVLVYVYEKFTNRRMVEKAALGLVTLLRAATSALNPNVLYTLCLIMSPFIWLVFSAPARLMSKFKYAKTIAGRMPFRHTLRLDCIIADLYDRFSPPIENRYDRDEIEGWFKRSNLSDIGIINYRGWVAWGKKR